MKNILLTLITFLVITFIGGNFIKASAQELQLTELKTIGGSSSDTIRDIAVDSNGVKYVVGFFNTTTDFDLDNVVSGDTKISNGLADAYVAAYDTDNTLLWVKQIGGTSTDISYGVITDSSSNVYVTGYFTGTVDFDLDNVVSGDTHTSAGNTDIFIAKYNSSGVLQWVNALGGTLADEGKGVYTGSDNFLYATGIVRGTSVDFDENNVVSGDTHTSAGDRDIYIAKYDLDGTLIWVNVVGSTGTDEGFAIKSDSSSNVYVTGRFSVTVDFDENNVVSNDTRTSLGPSNVFIAKYNSSGVLSWVKPVGGNTTNSLGYGIYVDSSGNVYAAGIRDSSSVDFDVDNSIPGDTSSGVSSGEAFFVKYNSAGVFQLQKSIIGAGPIILNDIVLDDSNNIYVSGHFDSASIDLDSDNAFPGDTISTAGSYDAFVARYDINFDLTWFKHFGDSSSEQALSVDIFSNKVYAAGFFGGTVDFDPDNIISNDTATANSTDGFYVSYGIPSNAIGQSMRIVLRDSENTNTVSDVEVWFDTVDIDTDSSLRISYDIAFSGGSSITTSDVTVTCDPDGVDPLSGTTMTGATVVTSEDGYLEIDTGVSSCADYTVVDINGGGGNDLTNPSTPGNYSWSVVVDNNNDETVDGQGATLAYVENENDVDITAYVPPVLDLELYETGSDTLLNPNACNLGILSINTVSTCTYDVGTGTNNTSGVSVYVVSDGPLDDGLGNDIDSCSGTNCDSLGGVGVDAGEEEYGFYLSDLGGGEFTAGGSFDTPYQAVPTVSTLLANSSTTGSGTTTGSSSQRLEVTHGASVSTATVQGSYSHIVTFTAFTN